MASEEAYLDKAIGRYSPEVASTARAALAKLRNQFPGARLLVYERKQSLPIGVAPPESGSAVMSLVLYPRWVRLFLLDGAGLADPQGRLEGAGTQVRSILVDEQADVLDDGYIRRLIEQALKAAAVDLKSGKGGIVLKSTIAASPVRPRGSRAQPTRSPERRPSARVRARRKG